MCAGGEDTEFQTYERLLETFPSGILSVVSDTWDLWRVINGYLPALKDQILGRDGKLVIRPDSGNPVDIICGTRMNPDRVHTQEVKTPEANPDYFGVVDLLWRIFGGTVNEAGYKVLDSHIGAIYGDSITRERAQLITDRLAKAGYASSNVVFGIGSFTYQYTTRDVFNSAVKATWAEIDGQAVNLQKDPSPTAV